MRKAIALFFRIPAGWAVAAVFLVPALETGMVFGFLLPGEVTVILGGALASRGNVPLAAVLFASVLGPLAGDTAGFFLGRRYGEELIRRRSKKRFDRAHRWLTKRAAGAIFLGRFVPFVRTVMPMTAGAVRIQPRRFFPWDFTAAALWGVGSTLLGYFAARDIEHAMRLGKQLTIAIGVLAAAGAAAYFWVKRRKKRGTRPARVSTRRSPRAAS